MKRFILVSLFLMLGISLAGCDGLGQTPPPPPHSIESLGTSIALTEHAPPPGYDSITLQTVDGSLDVISGYHTIFDLRFDGVYVDDGTPAKGHIQTEVWWDVIAPSRRVLLNAVGDAFATEPRQLEAVRIGEDYYLVDELGRCLSNVDATARSVASLDAGSLVGGVTGAPYSGTDAVLNGVQAYRYEVTVDRLDLPFLTRQADSIVTARGELWVSPEYDAVVRFYANISVENVLLLESDRPVAGELFIRLDAYDFGVVPNISIPYGC